MNLSSCGWWECLQFRATPVSWIRIQEAEAGVMQTRRRREKTRLESERGGELLQALRDGVQRGMSGGVGG